MTSAGATTMHGTSPGRRQQGLSLVEVMVALLVSLLLLGGVVQMFSSSRQTSRVHEATARMQETGRMALEVLSRDIRMADFWGCATEMNDVVNNLAAGTGFIDFATGGVVGTEGGPGNPDSIVLRGGQDSGLALEPPYGPQPSANVKVEAGNWLQQGDIVILSDCEQGDIFQISNANPGTAGTVVHNTGSTTSPGNYNANNPGCPGSNAHCLSKVYGSDATLFRAGETRYTVGMGARGQPALFRNGEEYIDGVEDLQILYGEDNDGNSVADYYVPADQVVDMDNVVSVRFAVVARSYDDNLTGDIAQTYSVLGENRVAPDERLRQVYSTTVNIRNRL